MQGNLAQDHLPELIRSIRQDEESGVLSLSRDKTSKHIYFGQGSMLFASSTLRDDRLGEFLVRNGKLTRTHFELASQKVKETGLRLGAVMVTMGLMTESEILARVDDQIRAIIYSVFPWNRGEYCFEPKKEPVSADLALDLPTVPIILEGVRRIQDPAVIQRALGSMDRIVNFAKDPATLSHGLHLTSEESFVLSRVDGQSTIANIVAISPIEEIQTLQCIYGLLSAGVLELGNKSRELTPSKKTAAFISSEVSQPPSLPPAHNRSSHLFPEERWIQQDVVNKLDSMKRGTYYDWLEVRRTANQAEIKKAYHSLVKTYHPDRLMSQELGHLKPGLESILSNFSNAYEVLSNPVARQRYDNSLRTEAPRGEDLSPRCTPGPPAPTPEELEKVTAEKHYREARRHFDDGDYHVTVKLLDVALRLDPNNPTYRKLQGRALAKNPNWRKDAEEHFQWVLDNNPTDVDCLVELGDLYGAAGLTRKADRMYFRALGLDPRNQELREKLIQRKQHPKWMSWLKILQD